MEADIIGDVHGHAEALQSLLAVLGYSERNGAFRHPGGRRAIFVGDLVDRGPGQRETIDIVRSMRDAGTALAVMGNHEFNAIGFATRDPLRPGEHFRPRRANTVRHHLAFLEAVGGADTPLHREFVAFFRTMPLWLDLPALRVAHACWSASSVAALASHVDDEARLTDAGLHAALRKGTAAYAACEIILKGPEMILPDGVTYRDAQGSVRKKSRTRWWDAGATTLKAACTERAVADQVPNDPLPQDSRIPLDKSKPVFFGHYWMEGRPMLLSPHRTCLDFSIAKGGVLCAYRFDGEPVLDGAKLLWV